MKIDQRLFNLLSMEQINALIRKAALLDEDDEHRVFHFSIGGFVYPVMITAMEITAPFI